MGTLRMPAHLPKEAAPVWRRTIETLADAGTLDRGTLAAVERYCVQWVRWQAAEAHIAADGEVILAKNKTQMVNPWLSIARTAAAQCQKSEAELGMVPGRRSSVKSAARPLNADGSPRPPPPLSPLDQILADQEAQFRAARADGEAAA